MFGTVAAASDLHGLACRQRRGHAWCIIVFIVIVGLYKQWRTFTFALAPTETVAQVKGGRKAPSSSSPRNSTMRNGTESLALRSKASITSAAMPRGKKVADNSFWNARHPNGSLGYVADPASLRRDRQLFLKSNLSNDESRPDDADYWRVLQGFQSRYR